jgi:hypothetical protein
MNEGDTQNYWPHQETNNFQSGDTPDQSFQPSSEAISWQANETINHNRDVMWFIVAGVVTLVLVVVSLLLSLWSFTALIIVMFIALMVYVKRPPRLLTYSLDDTGLRIGDELHSFEKFRSFGLLHDGQHFSVMMLPIKRFGQSVNVYFDEANGEKIVDILGAFLPMEDVHLDFIDNILRRLRL